MKALKWILTITTLLVAGYYIYDWWDNRNYFEMGQTGNYTIKVGDTFQFQLYENGTTGYQNCWINPGNCTNVELVGKDYTRSLQSKLGYNGSGGRITFKFRGIRKGIDTVVIISCPTGRERKDCSEFSIDSLKPIDSLNADNLFIVNVK
jgi:predicted secreted protein